MKSKIKAMQNQTLGRLGLGMLKNSVSAGRKIKGNERYFHYIWVWA